MTHLPTPPGFSPMDRLRRAARIGAWGALLAAVAYAAMPLWLPRGWIARRMADDLSAQLRRQVSIGRLTVSWSGGLVLEDLAVRDRPGGPNEYLATVSRVRCAFEPLRRLFTERVPRLEIGNVHVWLVADRDGRLNIDDLRDRRGGRLPSLRYRLDDVTCRIRTPEVEQRFRIDSLDCVLDPVQGMLRLFAATGVVREPPAGAGPGTPRLSVDARVRVPRLKRGEHLQGEIRIAWQDLALTDLPVPLISRLPVEQLAGTSTGDLVLTTHPDLTMDYDLDVEMRGVRVAAPALNRTAQVPDARLRGEGRFDPNEDALSARTLSWESPGISVRGRSSGALPCLLLDADAEPSLTLRLQGEVRDWAALRRELPAVDAWAQQAGLQAEGPMGFQLDASFGRSTVWCEGSLDGLRCALAASPGGRPALRLAAGAVKQLRAVVVLDRRAGRMSVRRVDLRLAGLRLAGNAQWAVPAPVGPDEDAGPGLGEVARTLALEAAWRAESMGEALNMAPILLGQVRGLEWSGPCEGELKVAPGEDGSQVSLACSLPAAGRLRWLPLVDKAAGVDARLEVAGRVAHAREGQAQDLSCRLAVGGGTLRLEPGGRVWFQTPGPARDPAGWLQDLELKWDLDWSIDRPEELLRCCPVWTQAAVGPERVVRGAARARTSGAWRGGSTSRRLDWQAALEAGNLDVRWDEWLDKAAGEPLTLECTGRIDRRDDGREQMAEARAQGRFGRLEASVLWSTSGQARSDAGQVSLEVALTSVSDALRLSPGAGRRVAVWSPTGGFTARLDDVITDGAHQGRLVLDAGGLGLRHKEAGWGKDPGVASHLALRWNLMPGGAGGPTDWTLQVQGVEALLAGLEVRGAGLLAEIRRGRSGEAGWMPLGFRPLEARVAQAAARGQVRCDLETGDLWPSLRALMESTEAAGEADWCVEARACEDGLALNGRVDAGAAGWRVETGHRLVPVVRKPVGLPLTVDWEATLSGASELHGRRVALRRVGLALDGNELDLEGEVEVPLDRPGEAWLAGPCAAMVRLPSPAVLVSVFENSPLQPQEGCLEVEVRVLAESGKAALQGLTCRADELRFLLAGEPVCLDAILRSARGRRPSSSWPAAWGVPTRPSQAMCGRTRACRGRGWGSMPVGSTSPICSGPGRRSSRAWPGPGGPRGRPETATGCWARCAGWPGRA